MNEAEMLLIFFFYLKASRLRVLKFLHFFLNFVNILFLFVNGEKFFDTKNIFVKLIFNK